MSTSNEKMKIEQTKSTPHEKRVATHSHIKGLGLCDDGTAEPIQSGFVGQENAREVLGKNKKEKKVNLTSYGILGKWHCGRDDQK